jgi:phosphohistidine swiveling domain-containing protein
MSRSRGVLAGVVRLANIRPEDQARIGPKAFRLGMMLQAGLPVPDGFCLSGAERSRFLTDTGLHDWIGRRVDAMATDADVGLLDEIRARVVAASLPPTLRHNLQNAWEVVLDCAPAAVRSSAIQEDLHHASFAGQYVSVLGCVDLAAIERAILACWASTWQPRLWAYYRHLGGDPRNLDVAVIVQRQIQAESAGVVFTINPITGNDTELVCEATWGLGAGLMGGTVAGDRYRYDWYIGRETGRHEATPRAVLSRVAVAKLAQLALKTQIHFGCPQDLEWARAQGRFWLLQARPITAIGFTGVQGEWTTANFRDGGVASDVCTPFLWSLYDSVWERVLPEYLRSIGLLDQRSSTDWAQVFFGRPYWNVGAVKYALKTLPGFKERTFDHGLGIEPVYDGDGYVTPTSRAGVVRAVRILIAVLRTLARRVAANRHLLSRQRPRLRELARSEPDKLTTPALFEQLQVLVECDHRQTESAYFLTAFAATNAEVQFMAIFDWLDPHGQLHGERLKLLGGLGGLSHLRKVSDLRIIASAIRNDPEALFAYASRTPRELVAALTRGELPLGTLVTSYLRQHGYHSPREHDIRVPSWQEDPLPVLESLHRYVSDPGTLEPSVAAAAQHNHFEAARQTVLSHLARNSRTGAGVWRSLLFVWSLNQLRKQLWWREEMRDLSTQTYQQIRLHACEIGRRLHQGGWLENAADVFLLRYPTLKQILIGLSSRSEVLAEVRRNRIYMDSFRTMVTPNEIRPRADAKRLSTPESAHPLTGIPCSPGVVEGRARVVTSLMQSHHLERGDILITRWFEPAWTAELGLVAGLVAETGGQLQHAAVIAREYGVPCILGIPRVTQLIADGQWVRVDADGGVVTVCA